ncbi:MAG: hypothetical protein ACREPV_01950 [Lysobacter sp.]
MKRLFLALLLAGAGAQLHAQEVNQIWEEYGKRIGSSSEVAPLGSNLFGDQVSLSNGALSFSVTDVSIPGNNSLPVAFTRTFTVRGRKGSHLNNDFPLADWEIDLPTISGVFAPDWVSGLLDAPGQRCSVTTPMAGRPPALWVDDHRFASKDYWQGHQLSLPSGGGELLLLDANRPRPSTGGPYFWITADQTRLACLPSIKNWSGGGEGFLAVAPDGTKYWFDWMAQYLQPTIEGSSFIEVSGTPKTITRRKARRRNVLYPTRVEDRFGNWVVYTYANARTAFVQLTRIESSDGRRIDVGYDSKGRISTVSANGKTWSYQYATVGAVDDSLSSVVLPDQSRWSIDFSELLNAKIEYLTGIPNEPWRTCTRPPDLVGPSSFVGRVVHPSGAVGEFTVGIRQHGRTNVPVNCLNFTLPHNDVSDDISFWPISYDGLSLTRKRITGPDIPEAVWSYRYLSPITYYFPSGNPQKPICPIYEDCSIPRCTSDECAGMSITVVEDQSGDWVRYFHGNSYRYNEGKLLRVEVGAGATALRSTINTYDLTQLDHEYPAKWGTSPRSHGEGFTSEYHRTLWHRAIVQGGTSFNYRVDTFDAFARPIKVTRSGIGADGAYIDPPTGVPALTAPATSTGPFAVSWTEVGAATDYRLEQRIDSGDWAQIYSGAALSDAVSGLANGNYGYRVRACNAGGCGERSAIKTTVVTVAPDSAPVITVPSTSYSGAFTVSWTAAVGTTTNYRLEQRKNGGGWTQVYRGAARSKAVSGLATGSYDYRARACNVEACGSESMFRTIVVTRPPSTAPTLSAPPRADISETFTVRWTLVPTATRYELQMNLDGAAWMTIYKGAAAYKPQTYRFEGNYAYRIRACNVGGCSGYSPARSVMVFGNGGGGGGGPCDTPICHDPYVTTPDEPLMQSESDEGGVR